jgi:hypothetical protein
MSGAGDQRREWVRRVLGVDPRASSGKPSLAQAVAAWQRALESIEGQIAGLQRVLLTSPDLELKEIAKFGLGAMTGSHKVKIQAALVEAQGPDADGRKAAAASRLVVAFRAHIASDARIAACDATPSPFGAPTAIRRTLGPALDALQSALQRA